MTTLTWLHLSDLHWQASSSQYGKPHRHDQIGVVTALVADLKRLEAEYGLKPDLVFFTGDLAYRGERAEYEEALQGFVWRLLDALRVKPSSFFVVPGNHDVNRGDFLAEVRDDILAVRSTDDARTIFAKPQPYLFPLRTFYERIGVNPPRPRGKDLKSLETTTRRPVHRKMFYTRVADIRGVKVGVLGLNTAWASGVVQDADRRALDHGELLLGLPMVEAALAELEPKPDITIALTHHSFHWLKEFDGILTERRLTAACHFILRGHLHHSGALWLNNPTQAAMTIAAGALHPRSRSPQAYNLVRLDFDARQGTVYLRRSQEPDGWRPDQETYANAKELYEFVLPEMDALPRPGLTVEGNRWQAPKRVSVSAKPQRASLEAWLNSHQLKYNPFAPADDRQHDNRPTPRFVDVGGLFDRLSQAEGVHVVLARPGCGKTTFCAQLAKAFQSAESSVSILLHTVKTVKELVAVTFPKLETRTIILIDSHANIASQYIKVWELKLKEWFQRACGSGQIVICFLPPGLRGLLEAGGGAHETKFHELDWSKDDLTAMIQARLEQASDGQVQQLGQLCDENVAALIDDELALHALGCPHHALELGRKLLDTHVKQTNLSPRIEEQTWVEVWRPWLYARLTKRFNLDELRTLADNLDVKADNLSQRRDAFANELIDVCARRGRIPALVEAYQEQAN